MTAPDSPKTIIGYLDEITARPGKTLAAKVSCEEPSFTAELVRLVSGDARPHGTGYREVPIDADFEASYPGRLQPIRPGSYAILPDLPALTTFQFECLVYPTLAKASSQIIARTPGFALAIAAETLILTTPSTRIELGRLELRRWHAIVIDVGEASVEVKLDRRGDGPAERDGSWQQAFDVDLETTAGDWILADRTFNGRIEAPTIYVDGALVGRWDFSVGIETSTIHDTSGHGRDGSLKQTPTRAVKGSRWDGSTQRWTDAPEQYAAIHFHEDDLTDCEWETDIAWTVPDLPSGLYALKLRAGDSEDYLPFVVTVPRPQRNRVAFLAATATYLAYANEVMSGFSKGAREPNAQYLRDHPEVGYSLYAYHADRSGVHFSSRLRPILNLKPKTLTWSFNADTNITAWLEHTGIPFDVISDEDLHVDGTDALAGYDVVITGAHPEYYSTDMLDAVAAWQADGGRLMYLGGNGFYWRIAYDPENPAIIEVRRAEGGTRAWMAEPGEYHHAFTGEYGGMWRRLGRPPNKTVGIGFAAQGFDGGTYYRRQTVADDPRAAFIFEGTTEGETFGDYGTQARGSAGEEIDRWDAALGSPMHALILASSENHRPGMLRVIEEIHMTEVPRGEAEIRADMVFFETPSGGAVFSTGSISYAGALSIDGYRNDIQTITRNVLDRFLDPTPFDYPAN